MAKEECPKWLREMGWQVDKLIQEPKNKDRFQQVLRRWYNDNARKREYQLLPLEPREHSVREMYVLLAAVHDACCREAPAIHPWSDLDERSTIGTKYFGVMGLVPRVLTPGDEPALKSFLDAVKGDVAKQPAEIGRDTKRTIAAIVISLVVDFIFELSVWFVPVTPFTWLKNHPNSYGLQGAIVLLVPCIVVGVLKRQYRKWCLRTAAISLVLLILSLLGGRSSS